MGKKTRLFVFIIGFFVVLIGLIIYRYEKLLIQTRKDLSFASVPGGTSTNKVYTAPEIIEFIKKSKEYLGDSVTIFDNGEMITNNGKFQGTINAVLSSTDNMAIVKSAMETNKLPLQYNVYVLAASYYRMQYASEFPQTK